MTFTVPNVQLNSSTLLVFGAIIVAFFVISLLAHMSRLFLDWSFSGAGIGFMIGMFTVVGVLGAVLYFARPSVPKLLSLLNKQDATAVLGADSSVISSQTVNSDFDHLGDSEKQLVKDNICKP